MFVWKICYFIKSLVNIKGRKFSVSIDGRECSTRYLREINHTIGWYATKLCYSHKLQRKDVNKLCFSAKQEDLHICYQWSNITISYKNLVTTNDKEAHTFCGCWNAIIICEINIGRDDSCLKFYICLEVVCLWSGWNKI